MNDRMRHVKSNRVFERDELAEEVSVSFQAEPVSGSGKNISKAGVYFVAEADVRVRVRIGAREIEGLLVRVENHGPGKTGIAVRFEASSLDGDEPPDADGDR